MLECGDWAGRFLRGDAPPVGRLASREARYKPVGFGASEAPKPTAPQLGRATRARPRPRGDRVGAMEHSEQPTRRAPQGSGWSIDDAIVRLRLWATEAAHALLEPRELKLGSGVGCDVRLHDRTGQLSREHAMLVPEAGGWQIRDLGSRNGLWVEGSRTGAGPLRAGARIQLGSLILVAESLGFIKLRSLAVPAHRMGGGSAGRGRRGAAGPPRRRDTAHAARPGRGRRPRAGGPPAPPGDARPRRAFRAPRRRRPRLGARSGGARHAVRPIRRRAAASAIVDAVRAAEIAVRPRLMLCAGAAAQAAALGAKPGRLAVIALPPLAARGDETARLVHETAQDVVAEIGAPSSGFTMRDLERLQAIRFSGLSDLEDSIRRVVAMRTWGVTAGAKRLGIKHSSLSQWARSRKRRLCT